MPITTTSGHEFRGSEKSLWAQELVKNYLLESPDISTMDLAHALRNDLISHGLSVNGADDRLLDVLYYAAQRLRGLVEQKIKPIRGEGPTEASEESEEEEEVEALPEASPQPKIQRTPEEIEEARAPIMEQMRARYLASVRAMTVDHVRGLGVLIPELEGQPGDKLIGDIYTQEQLDQLLPR